MKKVSAIIPTYNRSKELLKSIKTVLDQSYKGEIEIIIIDDSKESQQKIINEKFSEIIKNSKNRTINYIHKAKKEGSPVARNIGIKEAKGEYIAFLDDDDEWLPEKIEKQVEIMEKYKDVGLVVCYSLDKRFGRERTNKPTDEISHGNILKAFNLSSSSAYLVKREAIEKEDGFDISLPSAQEYDLAIRISKHYKVRCAPEILMIQNETKGQISENWNRKIKGLIAIYQKHGHKYNSISFFDGILNKVKFLGMLGLFSIGHLIGNRIYAVIIPIKEKYEV